MKLQLHLNRGILFGIESLTHMLIIECGFFGIGLNWQDHYCLDCNTYRPKTARIDEYYCDKCLSTKATAFQPLE